MRPEREIVWVCLIYDSSYTIDKPNLKMSAIPACLRDFEKLVDCGDGNSDFSKWFRQLVKLNIIEFKQRINRGLRNNILSDGYVAVGSRLIQYLNTNDNTKELWRSISKSANRGKII